MKDMFKCKNCGKELKFYFTVEHESIDGNQLEECFEKDNFSEMFNEIVTQTLHVYCENWKCDNKEIISEELNNFLVEEFEEYVVD